jgi:hypothetical protein
MAATAVLAQQDGKPFSGRLQNKEYSVYMNINLYDNNITVPNQELYGELPGYLGRERYNFYWPVVKAEVKNGKAMLTMVNDYGSEDLTAQLTQLNDSTFELKQLSGSALKVPNNGKWLKLPKTLLFIRR